MAATLVNSLYPPFVETFMPAFVYNDKAGAKVSFSISPYNDTNSLKRIHVTLINQSTNMSVLKSGIYGSNIIADDVLLIPFSSISIDKVTGLYYFYLPPTYLKTNGSSVSSVYQLETYYQVQIRFDNGDLTNQTVQGAANYLLQNRMHFSEWSEVTLLRPIYRPIFNFKTIDENIKIYEHSISVREAKASDKEIISRWTYEPESMSGDFQPLYYNKGLVPVDATIDWYNKAEDSKNSEYLTSYKITIYPEDDIDNPIVETEFFYIGLKNRDSIYYLADMTQAKENTNYVIKIYGITRNHYEFWDKRTICIMDYDAIPFDLEWIYSTIVINDNNLEYDKIITEEDGIIECTVKSSTDMPAGYLFIYRSSSKDNYLSNEIIQVTAENGFINRTFSDSTVGSLLSYRYKAQYLVKDGLWSRIHRSPMDVYPEFYDMLFLRDGKQLAVRFDGDISSLDLVVNRTKIDTIGSKYPKFAENAKMDYKQYSISGLIAAEEDFNRKFLDEKADIYKSSMDAYKENIGVIDLVRNDTAVPHHWNPSMFIKHQTYPHRHMYWEREFREKAMAWLNDGNPKLFRSMTEGNMIVMLMDVNLTPKESVDRMLYNFTATMYEIGDGYSLEELKKYKVISIRNDKETDDAGIDGDDNPLSTVYHLGQFIDDFPSVNDEMIDLVNGQYLNREEYNDSATWPLPKVTLTDMINAYYTGDNKNHNLQLGSVKLHDLRIQFTSKPYWMKNDATNKRLEKLNIKNIENLTEEEIRQLVENEDGETYFGYTFNIKVDIGEEESEWRSIFVHPKGYYQIPSDFIIEDLQFYQEDDFILDYFIEYQIDTAGAGLITRVRKIRDIVGQEYGIFELDKNLGKKILDKYNYKTYSDGSLATEELIEKWRGLSVDVNPYTLMELKYLDETEWYSVLVGETGVYNLSDEQEVVDIIFKGRHLIQAFEDNRPYLNEYEYILDDSVTSNTPVPSEDEENPQEDYWYEGYLTNSGTDYVLTDDVVRIGLMSDIADLSVFSWWDGLEDEIENNPNLYGYIKINNIEPQYNTIYKVVDKNGQNPIYVIYYLDQCWYLINFENQNKTSAIAKIPIHGAVNYKGTIIEYTYRS